MLLVFFSCAERLCPPAFFLSCCRREGLCSSFCKSVRIADKGLFPTGSPETPYHRSGQCAVFPEHFQCVKSPVKKRNVSESTHGAKMDHPFGIVPASPDPAPYKAIKILYDTSSRQFFRMAAWKSLRFSKLFSQDQHTGLWIEQESAGCRSAACQWPASRYRSA